MGAGSGCSGCSGSSRWQVLWPVGGVGRGCGDEGVEHGEVKHVAEARGRGVALDVFVFCAEDGEGEGEEVKEMAVLLRRAGGIHPAGACAGADGEADGATEALFLGTSRAASAAVEPTGVLAAEGRPAPDAAMPLPAPAPSGASRETRVRATTVTQALPGRVSSTVIKPKGATSSCAPGHTTWPFSAWAMATRTAAGTSSPLPPVRRRMDAAASACRWNGYTAACALVSPRAGCSTSCHPTLTACGSRAAGSSMHPSTCTAGLPASFPAWASAPRKAAHKKRRSQPRTSTTTPSPVTRTPTTRCMCTA